MPTDVPCSAGRNGGILLTVLWHEQTEEFVGPGHPETGKLGCVERDFTHVRRDLLVGGDLGGEDFGAVAGGNVINEAVSEGC